MSKMPHYPFKQWLSDIENEFLGGTSKVSIKPMKRSQMAAAFDPAQRERRRAEVQQLQGYRERLAALEPERTKLADRLDELQNQWKRLTRFTADDSPDRRNEELDKLEITIDSVQGRYTRIKAEIESLKTAIREAERSTDDELEFRANFGLQQIEALERYLAWKKEQYRLLASFKQFEIRCQDEEAYYAVLAKMLKYFGLTDILPEWSDIFLVDDPEDRSMMAHEYRLGFRNMNHPSFTRLDPDPHVRSKMLKAFWDSVNADDLPHILGLNGKAET